MLIRSMGARAMGSRGGRLEEEKDAKGRSEERKAEMKITGAAESQEDVECSLPALVEEAWGMRRREGGRGGGGRRYGGSGGEGRDEGGFE